MEKKNLFTGILATFCFPLTKVFPWVLLLGYTVQPHNGAKDSVDPITAEAFVNLTMADSVRTLSPWALIMAKAKPSLAERWKLVYVPMRICWAIIRDTLARKQGKCLGFKRSLSPCRYEICINWISTFWGDIERPPLHCHVFLSSTQTKLLSSIPSPHTSSLS